MLRNLGLGVARFDFPYKRPGADGKRRALPPDRMPVLIEAVGTAAHRAQAELKPDFLLLAGHSMGGRAMSMAVAEGLLAPKGPACPGLLLFSYPWHPPKKPGQLRVSHLAGLGVPALALSGTRDPFCDRGRLAEVFRELPRDFEVRFLEGADHGWAVARKSGGTGAEVFAEAGAACRQWVRRIVR